MFRKLAIAVITAWAALLETVADAIAATLPPPAAGSPRLRVVAPGRLCLRLLIVSRLRADLDARRPPGGAMPAAWPVTAPSRRPPRRRGRAADSGRATRDRPGGYSILDPMSSRVSSCSARKQGQPRVAWSCAVADPDVGRV